MKIILSRRNFSAFLYPFVTLKIVESISGDVQHDKKGSCGKAYDQSFFGGGLVHGALFLHNASSAKRSKSGDFSQKGFS